MTAFATINLNAFAHNLQIVHQRSDAKIIGMIKANAYGHGLISIGCFLEKQDLVNMLAVATVEEGLSLRKAGIQKPILIMLGFLNQEELQIGLENNFQFVVHRIGQFELLETLPADSISVWLKIDVGMHRLGFDSNQAEEMYQRLKQLMAVKKPLCFLTHFPSSDIAITHQQAQDFADLTQHWIGEKSLSNSVTLFSHTTIQNDWVRPGIMLYGISSLLNKTGLELNLKPVMTLRAPVIAIRHFQKNDPIGYDGTWVCPENMSIAIVGIGYGDGYPRSAKSGTPVLIRGRKAPLIGRVSMNMIAVDLRGFDLPEIGEEVILWGEGLPVEIIASYADTIAYELLCRLSRTVKFRYT
jgi:alanine racemase